LSLAFSLIKLYPKAKNPALTFDEETAKNGKEDKEKAH